MLIADVFDITHCVAWPESITVDEAGEWIDSGQWGIIPRYVGGRGSVSYLHPMREGVIFSDGVTPSYRYEAGTYENIGVW